MGNTVNVIAYQVKGFNFPTYEKAVRISGSEKGIVEHVIMISRKSYESSVHSNDSWKLADEVTSTT